MFLGFFFKIQRTILQTMIFEQEPIIPDLISKRSLPREMGRRSKMEPKNFVEKGEAKEYIIRKKL